MTNNELDLKTTYKNYIKEIKQKIASEGGYISNEGIAGELGYTREHFQNMMGPKGNITEQHIKDLILRYPYLKENLTQEEAPANVVSYQENELILKRSIENLTETERINARSIERLIFLLEVKMGVAGPELASPNQHTISIDKKKTGPKAG